MSFIALAHNNPIIKELLKLNDNDWINENAYERYLEQVRLRGDVFTLGDEEGLLLKNISAVHPLTGENIPIYLSTYVLNDYGTGAIMGVPFHDERDCAFALKNGIEMIQVIEGDEENDFDNCVLVNSGEYNGLKASEGAQRIVEKLENMQLGKRQTVYRLRDWLVSRQRYWGVPIPIVFCQ